MPRPKPSFPPCFLGALGGFSFFFGLSKMIKTQSVQGAFRFVAAALRLNRLVCCMERKCFEFCNRFENAIFYCKTIRFFAGAEPRKLLSINVLAIRGYRETTRVLRIGARSCRKTWSFVVSVTEHNESQSLGLGG